MWMGGTPTIIRAVLLSSTMLATYSEIKDGLQTKFPKVFVRCAFSAEIYTRRCHWFPHMFA
jgi:hypothetical protein